MTLTGQFRKPFSEQVAAFRLRLANLQPTATWEDVWQEQHDRAFMVAGAMKADLLADLAAAVDSAVTKGTTLEQFRADFRAIVERHGWHGWTGEGTKGGEAWRTKVIYKTNLATTYAAGRWAQIRAAGYPLIVYRHGGSLDPRIQHLGWDGLILPADHPFWTTHAPPNGWGCSCYISGARSQRGAVRLGGKPGKELPEGWAALSPKTGAPEGIDRGWAYAPGASVAEEISALARTKAENLPTPLATALTEEVAARQAAATEAAMEALLGQIMASRYVNEIMQAARSAKEPRLSVSEIAAIKTYTGPFYRAINRVIREVSNRKAPRSDPHFRITTVMDTALSKLPTFEGLVYRGVQVLPRGWAARLDRLEPGDIIQFRAFTSASRSADRAFGGPVQFRIRSITGRRVEALSLSQSELEVLFPRGLQFRVIESTFDGSVRRIDLEEVAAEDWTRAPKELMSEDLG